MSQGVSVHEGLGVLVDEQGLPLRVSQVLALLAGALDHLRHSDDELDSIVRRLAVEGHSDMVGQLDFDWFIGGYDYEHRMQLVLELVHTVYAANNVCQANIVTGRTIPT